MFRCAVRRGYAGHNPVEKVERAPEQEKVPRPYTDDELACLISELPDWALDVAVVAVDTGMRKSELQHLLWDHVSFESALIQVVGTKSKKAREIPMTARVREILERLNAENRSGSVVSLHVFGPSADILKQMQKAGWRAGVEGANQ